MTKNKKVLIIEDEPTVLYALQKTVSEAGYEVLTAEEGEKGLEMIKKEMPDLVLLDIILPKINGFDILEFAKMEEKTKNIPIIMLTNLNDKDSITKSATLGAAGHLIKIENHPKDVVNYINKIFGKINASKPTSSGSA